MSSHRRRNTPGPPSALTTNLANRNVTSGNVWELIVPIALMIIVFSVHVMSPVCTSGDSRWAIPTALSIIRYGDVDIDEYHDLSEKWSDYGVVTINHAKYTCFPVSTYLFAVPVTAIFSTLWTDERIIAEREALEKITASSMVALAALFVFLIARRRLNVGWSAILVILFAFCSPMWSTASRALWQHGPAVTAIMVALYLLVRAKDEESRYLFLLLGLSLGCSYVLRPVHAISVTVISLYVAVFHTRQLPWLCLGGCVIATMFLLGNLATYGVLLDPYYSATRLSFHPDFFTALAGNIVSPNRGLLLSFPLAVPAVVGAVISIRAGEKDRRLNMFLMCVVPLHWIAISAFPRWWAGHSYGSRLFTDMMPYFVYFLIPVFAAISAQERWRKVLFTSLIVPLIAWSFFVHARGAYTYEGHSWNATPVNVDLHSERLWDWRDIQFLRGL